MPVTKNIKYIKLITGEDLLGELIGVNENGWDIDFNSVLVLLVLPGKNPNEQPRVVPQPWLPFSDAKDSKYSIAKTAIVTIRPAHEQFVKVYNQIFSPIIQPGSLKSFELPGQV